VYPGKLILPAFSGAGPVRIYSFVSAINPQMRLKYSYKIIWELCQALSKNKLLDSYGIIRYTWTVVGDGG